MSESPDRATCLHESGGHGRETGPSHMKRETDSSSMRWETGPSHIDRLHHHGVLESIRKHDIVL